MPSHLINKCKWQCKSRLCIIAEHLCPAIWGVHCCCSRNCFVQVCSQLKVNGCCTHQCSVCLLMGERGANHGWPQLQSHTEASWSTNLCHRLAGTLHGLSHNGCLQRTCACAAAIAHCCKYADAFVAISGTSGDSHSWQQHKMTPSRD